MKILVIILAINYQNAKVIKEKKSKHIFEKRLNDSRMRENVNILFSQSFEIYK